LWSSLIENSKVIDSRVLGLATALVVAGYGTKVGLFPFHWWLPDAYQTAPSPVSAILASVLEACGFLALFRWCGIAGSHFSKLILVLGVLSMGFGSILMLTQRDLKRLLAYSSIENMGVVGVGLGLGGYGSVYALFHLVNHSLLKSAAFFSVGNIEVSSNSGVNRVSGVIGVSRLLSFSMISSAFFLAGFPPSSMFLSKLGVLCETARFKLLLMLYAFFSFISLAALTYRFMEACMGVSSELKKPVPLLSAVSLALVVVSIVLGVFPAPALEVISRVSSWLGG